MEKLYKKSIFWFRRDLRLTDNAALYYALLESTEVIPVFIFDKNILDDLSSYDRRVDFIQKTIIDLRHQLNKIGSDLLILHEKAETGILKIAHKYQAQAIYSNEDYEPLAVKRDSIIQKRLFDKDVFFHQFKDTVIFSKDEVLNKAKKPYTVFTPYKNAWKDKLNEFYYSSHPVEDYYKFLTKEKFTICPTLEKLGFKETNLKQLNITPGNIGAKLAWDEFKKDNLLNYNTDRDYPALDATSYLSIHNRFGTISIRQLVEDTIYLKKQTKNTLGLDTWLNELIWRDFYFQLTYHFPHIDKKPFKKEYEKLTWQNNSDYFKAWCMGETGYPIIDAAMNQINQTGFMHNRLRMVVASFLTKDLLCSYTMGENYFSQKLNDFDFSANNGGWQWAASTGCDAQPYFRIFNPTSQSEKFDKDAHFIKKWLPSLRKVPPQYLHAPWEHTDKIKEFGVVLGKHYPERIVVHSIQRDKILSIFKQARLNKIEQK